MRRLIRLQVYLAAFLSLAVGGTLSSRAHAQGTVVETGFRVKHFASCGQGSPGQLIEIRDAECSPGGIWGDFVYFIHLDASGEDGRVDRIAPNGKVSGFLSAFDVPTGMAFSAPQGPFEDRLWVNDAVLTAGMFGFSPVTGPLFTCEKPGFFTFDPSGAFGYHMFLAGPDGIYRLEAPACDPSQVPPRLLFVLDGGRPLEFGPGGDWGTDLYAAGGEVYAPDGSLTLFPFPFTEVTWGFGNRWNGDMFARQAGSSDVFRVHPDGTSTLFATGFIGDLEFCGGSLWIIQPGDCVKITPKASRVRPIVEPQLAPRPIGAD